MPLRTKLLPEIGIIKKDLRNLSHEATNETYKRKDKVMLLVR